MPRHTPTLHPHAETGDVNEPEADRPIRPLPFTANSSSGNAIPNRLKTRHKNTYSPATGAISAPTANPFSTSNVPQYTAKYHDIYSQFLQRYRSGPEEDPRNDPDSHYFHRGLGQLVDAGGESDEEELGRPLSGVADVHDKFSSLMLDSDPIEPETAEDLERLEWQTMLASVLDGDVLKSEKTRIAVALASSDQESNNFHTNIWIEMRAKVSGRSEEEERKKLEERRLRTVDHVIHEVLTFHTKDIFSSPDPGTAALQQVNEVIRHLDVVHSLYPNLKAFQLDKPVVADSEFQALRDALITWSTVFTSLRSQINILLRWTGSDTLDVTAPGTGPNQDSETQADGSSMADGSTFLERLLKEESIQMTFAKGFMTTVHSLIGTARDAQVNLAAQSKKLGLPTFERELIPLISFPTQLAQASLRVRLEYAQKLKDPEVIIIDQMTDDLKLNIGIACTLKRQYVAFLSPDPGGNWALPPCISKDYDTSVLEALSFLFRLVHWKLKSGARDIYFKETDVLESQWATFNDVALTSAGGASMVAEQLW